MATQIILVPDFFFHEWDSGLGELWLCLRSYVDIKAFDDWVQHPHEAARYSYALADEVLDCARMDLTEIILPSDADLWIAATDQSHVVRWTEYARRRDTFIDATQFPLDAPTEMKGQGSFPWLAGEALRLRAMDQGSETARQWAALSMNAGKELPLSAPSNRPWSTRTLPDSYTPNPPFRIASGSAAGSLHWWLGQMHRLGLKADGSVTAIQGLDIVLSWGTATYDGVNPPNFAQHQRWSMPSGAPPSPVEQARNAFVGDWFKAVPGAFGMKPSVTAVSRPDRVYWNPRLTNFRSETLAFDNGVYATAERARATNSDTLLRPELQPGDLRAGLQILEARVEPAGGGATVAVTPGLLLRGRLRPYRRFREARSTDSAQPAIDTPCLFEPDADCAQLLSGLLAAPPERFWSAVEAAKVAENAPARTWTVARGLAGRLPWDGPEQHLRVVLSSSWTSSGAGELLTFGQGRLELFLPLTAPLAFAPAARDPRRDADVFFAEETPALLPDYARLSPQPMANALKVVTGPGKVSLAAVYENEFEFDRSQSAVRTEATLDVTTPATAQSPVPTPEASFAEDLSSYNTLRLRRADGSLARELWSPVGVRWADKTVHDSLESCGPAAGNTAQGMTQIVPVAHGWPRVPSDAPEIGPDNWLTARAMMADHYRVGAARPDRALGVVAQHTYAAKLDLGTTLEAEPRLPWPVELPTAAEAREDAAPADPFLTVAYDPGAGVLQLVFHPKVLRYDAPPARKDHSSQKTSAEAEADTAAYARVTRGLTAWRSLAEIWRADAVWLEIEAVAYRLGPDPTGRWPDSWRGALQRGKPKSIAIPAPALQDLKAWALACFNAADPAGFSLTVPVDEHDWILADRASVAQVWLHARRAAALGAADLPDDGSELVVGSGGAFPDFQGLLDKARGLNVDQAKLTKAHIAWRDTLTAGRDTITPRPPAGPGNQAAPAALDAIISELVGTDWFAPPGAPDYSGLELDSLLIPVGFANLSRSQELGALTEPALERLALAIQDLADLAFPALCPQPPPRPPPPAPAPSSPAKPNWPLVFQQLATLGAGLDAFTAAIATRLTIPEPYAGAGGGVQPAIQAWSARLRPGAGDPAALKALQTAVMEVLSDHPAAYAEAKGLLLSVLALRGAKAGHPDLGSVAAARYRREIRPVKPAPLAAGADGAMDVAAVTAELTVQQTLALSDAPVGSVWSEGLAFLEVLPDTTYDNAFDVVAGGQAIDPFEAAIDPASITKPWTVRLPTSPAGTENLTTDRRSIPLASRAALLTPLRQRAQAIPGFQTDRLRAGQKVSSADLLRESRLGTPASPDLYVAGVWGPSGAATLRIDQEVFTAVYVVRGDEEGDSGAPDMFDNDRFYPRAAFGASVSLVAVDPPQGIATAPLPALIVDALKALSSAERLSANAYAQVAAVSGSLPAIADRLMLPNAVAESLGFALGVSLTGPEPYSATFRPNGLSPPKGLLQLSFLRRLDGGDRALAWLVADFAAEVWSPLEIVLVQGRNTEDQDYAFAPEFRQVEMSLTARHQPGKQGANTAADWRKPGKMLAAPPNWWGGSPTLARILAIVAQPGSWWSFDLAASKAALDAGFRLSVTIFQEQFLRPPQEAGAAPAQRFPLLNVEARSRADLDTVVASFGQEYSTFSLDLQWYSATGAPALRLERLFVDFTTAARTSDR